MVVFAGAGVSMSPPSGYPNFGELALQVASGSQLPRERNEPPDRFLGRLKNLGVEVHLRARNILSDPSSRPNQVHRDLLRLFRSEADIRLVTTNFDTHFTTAAGETSENEPAIFNAPALPLGNDFEGIVYLHGSVKQEPERLVLTDRDFGRAYLTEGWARRFLQAMFERYTILFVGYSHSDVVTNYLARGLPPYTQGQRYALTHENDPERWNLLGVSPIRYPWTAEAPNDHEALVRSLGRWVAVVRMGVFDHQQRIRDMLRLPPPSRLEDADYIEDALNDPAKTRFFVQHARSLEWLRWADGKSAFEEMFVSPLPGSEISKDLAQWFAEHFACEYPDEALEIVRRRGAQLNPLLWGAVAHNIAFKLDQGNPRPEAQTVAKWVAVLLSSPKPEGASNSLAYMLEGCSRPENSLTAVLLFEHLTAPRPRLQRVFPFQDERARLEIELVGDTHSLKESWDAHLPPNLAVLAKQLEPILVGHLQRTHFLLRSTGAANEVWDSISAVRAAVEPHEQNLDDTGINLLVDFARDIIEWVVQDNPEDAHRLVETLISYDVPLLKRLAVHGVIETPTLYADEKLQWVLQNELLYVYGARHEVFRLLADAYPKASEHLQLRLLERAKLGPREEGGRSLEERDRQYEIYNLLAWLHRVAPNSHITTQRFEESQQEHQGEFEPREHPDLWAYVSRLASPKSPMTVEELLAENPAEIVDRLLSYQGDRAERVTRDALLRTVSEAVAQSYTWGRTLSEALEERQAWDSDLWKSILEGWQKECLAEDQWAEVLNFLVERAEIYTFANEISELLWRCTGEDRENRIPSSFLPLTDTLAERLWDAFEGTPTEKNHSEGWVSRAINEPGGKLTQFWLLALSRRRTEAGDKWDGLPDEYRLYLGRVLTDDSYAADLGRVVLARELYFLFSSDADWTKQNILPLLNWSRDARIAKQAWHGFLSSQRWSEALMGDLECISKPCWRQAGRQQ